MERDEFNEEQLEAVLGGIPNEVARDEIQKSDIRQYIENLEKHAEIIINQANTADYDRDSSSKRGSR